MKREIYGLEGFTRGRKLDTVGQDESDTAEFFFDNVRVPATTSSAISPQAAQILEGPPRYRSSGEGTRQGDAPDTSEPSRWVEVPAQLSCRIEVC